MNFFDASLYGIIQGLTEFLPVSSSGHLALLPKFLSFSDPGVFFDLAMHVGTALAVAIYFHKDLLEYLKGLFKVISTQKISSSYYACNFTITTVVSVIFIFIFKGLSEEFGRSPLMISINLSLFGLLMWWFDSRAHKEKTNIMWESLDIKRSFLVGLFQAIAIFPGVSRSGSTLTISRAIGLGRHEATRFSFLLSLPIILGGFCFKLLELKGSALSFEWNELVFGLVISFIVGLITIHIFLKVIERIGLWAFSIYRVILAGIVFVYLVY